MLIVIRISNGMKVNRTVPALEEKRTIIEHKNLLQDSWTSNKKRTAKLNRQKDRASTRTYELEKVKC